MLARAVLYNCVVMPEFSLLLEQPVTTAVGR
jgi:hypothetical protein